LTSLLASPATELPPLERLDTLPPFPADGSVLTLAPMVVQWAESILIQPNGPNAGQPFQFTPRQLRFLCWWYAVDEDGRWLFQHGVRRLAKGSGKSPFAAVLALCEFCGPVRVDDIDLKRRIVYGKPMPMPWVQIAATAESQTANTMRMVRAFASKQSPVVEAYDIDWGKTALYRLPEGKLEIISSSPHAAEGAEPSLIIADETEWWLPNNNGQALMETLLDNLAKSGSRMLETSNAWIPGQNSVAEKTWEAWVAQEEGRTFSAAGRILYDAVMSRPDLDWDDEDQVREDLRRIYADAWWQDIDGVLKRVFSPKAVKSDIKRKYGNRPEVAEDAWVDPADWSAMVDVGRKVEDGESIVLFFDGSKSRDATALVGCCMSDGHVFHVYSYEPKPKHDGSEPDAVPVAEVDLAVKQAFERWDVVGFFADVREWETYSKVIWPDRYKDQLLVWAQPTGKQPEPIAWDMRGGGKDKNDPESAGRRAEFTQAAELCEAEIRERAFTHDGNPVIARHIANARRRPNQHGVSIGKESRDSPRKIDAAVCVIGARMVRRQVLGSKAWQKRRRGSGRAMFL
jgi:hypothetical protein